MIDKTKVPNKMMEANPPVVVEFKFKELIHLLALRDSLGLDEVLTDEDLKEQVEKSSAVSILTGVLKMVKKASESLGESEERTTQIAEMESKLADAKSRIHAITLEAHNDNIALGKKLLDAFNKAVEDYK